MKTDEKVSGPPEEPAKVVDTPKSMAESPAKNEEPTKAKPATEVAPTPTPEAKQVSAPAVKPQDEAK